MSVKAKFVVNSISRVQGSVPVLDENGKQVSWKPGEVRTIKMSPVYGNGDPNHENTKFWQASPSGSFELSCVNLEAAEQFELGEEYIFEISKAK